MTLFLFLLCRLAVTFLCSRLAGALGRRACNTFRIFCFAVSLMRGCCRRMYSRRAFVLGYWRRSLLSLSLAGISAASLLRFLEDVRSSPRESRRSSPPSRPEPPSRRLSLGPSLGGPRIDPPRPPLTHSSPNLPLVAPSRLPLSSLPLSIRPTSTRPSPRCRESRPDTGGSLPGPGGGSLMVLLANGSRVDRRGWIGSLLGSRSRLRSMPGGGPGRRSFRSWFSLPRGSLISRSPR